MYWRKGKSTFLFSNVTFFFPPSKSKWSHTATLIKKFIGILLFCRLSLVQNRFYKLLDYWPLAGQCCAFSMHVCKAADKIATSRGVTIGYRDSAWPALLTPCITQHLTTLTPFMFLVQYNHAMHHLVDAVIKRFNWHLGPDLVLKNYFNVIWYHSSLTDHTLNCHWTGCLLETLNFDWILLGLGSTDCALLLSSSSWCVVIKDLNVSMRMVKW